MLFDFRFRFTDIYNCYDDKHIYRCVRLDEACYTDLATGQLAIIRSNYRCLLDMVD